MLSDQQKEAVRRFAEKEMVAASGTYLKDVSEDVSKEVQDRIVQNVMDEVFLGKPKKRNVPNS